MSTESARSRTRFGIAAGCALVAAGLAVSPALGDGERITTQYYVDVMQMDDIRAAGLDGEGVTIAVIDTPLDPTVPELAGADIDVKDTGCSEDDLRVLDPAHATGTLSIMASPDYGWAPKAHYVTYASKPFLGAKEDGVSRCEEGADHAKLLATAAREGADIIVLAMSFVPSEQTAINIFEAIDHGAAVVFAVGNNGSDEGLDNGGLANGSIGVAAVDTEGQWAPFSNWGVGIDITAPGTGIATRERADDGSMSIIYQDAFGTSLAAPQVAGLLAVGKQKYPDATMNQLTRALLDSAYRGDRTGWDQHYGWGVIYPGAFLQIDPTTLEDTNPLLDKNPELPGAQGLQDLRDGLVYPHLVENPDYIYRGPDDIELSYPGRVQRCTSPRYEREDPPAECKGLAAILSPNGSGISPVALVLGGGLVVIGIGAIVTVIAVIATQRKKAAGGGIAGPDGGRTVPPGDGPAAPPQP